MSKIIKSKKSNISQKINTFFIMLIFLTQFLLQVSSKKLDFTKGGKNLPHSCKKGNQAPIDISPPFTYKGKKRK